MSPWEALVLGAVEGITEYLPISSTGHLLLAERALSIEKSPEADAFLVAIQGGAIVAVLGLYRARAVGVARGLLGQDPAGLSLARSLLLAFLPAAVLGLVFEERIERHLFGLWPVAAAWFAGGVLLLLLARRGARAGGVAVEAMSARAALLVGLAQCLALWPGTSRSLATIAGGLVAGLSVAAAVEFSFLLGVVTLGAAAAW
jgi:undecaprenyl-diphosphatase